MRCSRTARGFGFGSSTVFAAARKRVTVHTNPNAVTSGRTTGLLMDRPSHSLKFN